MLPPVFPRLHRGVGVSSGVRALLLGLSYGLAFAGAAALAHHAGTTWSPKPAWDPRAPGPSEPADSAPVAATGPILVDPVPEAPPEAPITARTQCEQHTDSGLGYTVIARGQGRRPALDDTVEVVFAGWGSDGEPLPSLPIDGHALFRVNTLIPGWVEGLRLMRPGGHLRLCIPEELAYKGRPAGPSGTLVFDVRLVGIEPVLIAR